MPPTLLKVPLKRCSTAASLVLTIPVKVFEVRGLSLVVGLSDLKSGWRRVECWGKSAILEDAAIFALRLQSRDGTSRGFSVECQLLGA